MAREKRTTETDAVAIALPIAVWVCAGLSVAPGWEESRQLVALAAGATWVAFWGVLTDVRHLVRGLRLLAVVIAAAWLHYAGIRIDTLKVPFSTTFVDVGLWSFLVAAVWMGICASLFARAGTIPGAAYGVGAIAWLTLATVCTLQPMVTGPGPWLLSAIMGVTCLVLFMVSARLPRTSGTAGAYVLGFVLGAGSIMGMLKNTAFLAAVLPLLLISIPLFGATYSYVADLRRGSGMALTQRRDHIHELLLRQGYSPRQVALVLVSAAAWCGLLAVLLVALIEVHFGLKAALLVAWVAFGFVSGYVLLRILPREVGSRPEAIRLLGVRITPVSMAEAQARARRYIAEGSPHMIVTSDASGVIRAQDDPELRDIMEHADLVTADGQGVVLASRLLNVPIRERVSGVDMVERLCEVAAEEGRSVFLLGGAEGVAEAAAERLIANVPRLEVAGTHHGYFTPDEEPAIIQRIRESRPAVLFVAFGIPRQEKWLRAHMDELEVPVCIGVGGSLDVISGRLKRAPLWMRRCGLEWLFRVIQEPRRLPRLKALPRIAWLALSALARGETGDELKEAAGSERTGETA